MYDVERKERDTQATAAVSLTMTLSPVWANSSSVTCRGLEANY